MRAVQAEEDRNSGQEDGDEELERILFIIFCDYCNLFRVARQQGCYIVVYGSFVRLWVRVIIMPLEAEWMR